MKVLIVGGGGREHALAWKVSESPKVKNIFVAPGNAGTAIEAKCENIAISARDLDALRNFAIDQEIDLTIVGPDDPLADGIVDFFQEKELRIFGPTKAAARLEWSKSFTKDFLKRHNIPTAAYATFANFDAAERYIRQQGAPIVIKADGLAAGKGVTVALTVAEAIEAAKDCLQQNRFGDAGSSIVVEEFMEGEEASFTCLCDGTDYLILPTSQDHKRALDGDRGLNTGGMGAYSPAPVVTKDVERLVLDQIIQPILEGMRAEGAPFVGFLYVGLMIKQTVPRVVEINARFGDPETQVLLSRIKSDFVELVEAAIDGRLSEKQIEIDSRASLCVVMTSGGYPGMYEKGKNIRGLDEIDDSRVNVFHAGTKLEEDRVVTAGGRVIGVTALGDSIQDAKELAYKFVEKISWEQEFHRNDIGWRALSQ